MAQEVEFRLNTSAKDARWMRGNALSESIKINPDKVRAALITAMRPGLSALRQNVAQAKTRTGRLRRSPGVLTRKYGGAQRLIMVGLVGYVSGVAPHSKYLELGTPPRFGRGQIKARRYAWLAYFRNQETMRDIAKQQLEQVMLEAASAAR